MSTYEEAKAAVESRSDLVRGQGAIADEVSAAQAELGAFPDNFSRFLRDFGYAAFNGSNIWGFPPECSPWIRLVEMNRVERRDFGLPAGYIAFLNDGGGDLSCFPTQEGASCEVVIWSHDQRIAIPYAQTFADYLLYLHSDDPRYLI